MTSQELNTSDMISVTKRLTQILQEEIALIKEMRLTELNRYNDEKSKLISLMETYKNILKNNPQIIKSMSKYELSEMKDILGEFEGTLAEDGDQLIKAKKVHEIIMDAIKTVMEDIGKEKATYNKFGKLDQGKKKILYIAPLSISGSF